MRPKKFLIINPFGIGDVLFTTAVVRAIRYNFPDSFIGYWCNERTSPILKDNPNIDKIFALSRGDIKKIYRKSILRGISRSLQLFFGIRQEHFDISLDFSLDCRYSLLSKIAGIKKRIGFNYKRRGRFLTDRIDIEGYASRHVVEYYLDLLKFIDVKPQGGNLDLYISETDKIKGKDILSSAGVSEKDLVIGICPGGGASWGKDAAVKHWPAGKFAQLADRITKNFAAKILILGDESEKEITAALINTMENKPVDLTSKTSLEELAAVISNLNLLIANDGGPLHIAAALGKKTVSFFGPVDPVVYGPYPADEKRHIVLRRHLECSPCYHKFRLPACQRNRECLEKINVELAYAAVANLLQLP